MLAATAGALRAQPAAEQAEAGRRVYISSCQRCHGINLVTNGIGFDLRTFPPHDRARFDRSVNQGLRAMPAWGGTLKPGQLDQLWAYLGSVNGWPADGAAPSGAAAASSPP
ncbi:MAG: hypothetical protein RLZZ524_2272 [Pseudomonadota bacterium]